MRLAAVVIIQLVESVVGTLKIVRVRAIEGAETDEKTDRKGIHRFQADHRLHSPLRRILPNADASYFAIKTVRNNCPSACRLIHDRERRIKRSNSKKNRTWRVDFAI